MTIFDDFVRADATPSRHNERRFEFLNRSASQYFAAVRDLMDEWFSHLPAAAQDDMRGALRSDDRQMESAFWELFLHEAYTRSGYEVEIHPEISDMPTHPDFRMTRDSERFYLEVVSVGQAASAIAEDARLQAVHQVLADLKVENFVIDLSTHKVGPGSLSTKGLRAQLQAWLKSLDPAAVAKTYETGGYRGFAGLPTSAWTDAGWELEFHALPLNEEGRSTARSALGMLGPGEAVVVNNVSGIVRALDSKKKKYGQLDAPLVVAVQSNTLYPTKDYEFEQALFGVSPYRPAESPQHLDSLFEKGFWLTKAGWRYGTVPQVVTIAGLSPWTVTRVQPRLWNTLENGVTLTLQPDWLARMDLSVEATPLNATTMASCFGIAEDWPSRDDPDFDLD